MATKKPTKTPKSSRSSKSQKSPKQSHWGRYLWVALLCVIAIIGTVVYATIFAKTDRPAQEFTVKKGDTYQSVIIKNRWQSSPLSSDIIAKLYLKIYARTPLQEGVYQVPAGASIAQAVDVFRQGAKVMMVKVQIIEGKTIKDLYQTIKNTQGVELLVLTPKADGYSWTDVARDNEQVAKALGISDISHLEGMFAPNTYFFHHGISDKEILTTLYDKQKTILDKAWQQKAADLPYSTPYQALIMASIIEKETGIASERGLVSAVFVNRLRKNMRLQTDPTIIYGLFDRYDGKIYKSNIAEKTDYNTYQMDGLPPTPIALPSQAAIEAALHPDNSDALFFVATGKGGHKFSRTLDEHNQAVAEYRAVMRQKQAQDSK